MMRALVLLALCLVMAAATDSSGEADAIKFDLIKDVGPLVIADHHEGFIPAICQYVDLLNLRMRTIADLVGLEFAPGCVPIRPGNESCACYKRLRIECTYAPGTDSDGMNAFYAVMTRDRYILQGGEALLKEVRATGTWDAVVVKMHYTEF